MAVGRKRGVKPLMARDWIFGSRPRRLALRFVFSNQPPSGGWTKTDIAAGCGVSKHGGADEHIEGLLALGLLTVDGGRYRPGSPTSSLRVHLSKLVAALEDVPDQRITELKARQAAGRDEGEGR